MRLFASFLYRTIRVLVLLWLTSPTAGAQNVPMPLESPRHDLAELMISGRVFLPESPDWQTTAFGATWVAVESPFRIVRIDPKSARVIVAIPIGPDACLGIVAAVGSLWIPTCGDHLLNQVDPKTNTIVSRLTVPISSPLDGSFAYAAGSFWLPANSEDPSLSLIARFDPEAGQVIATVKVPADTATVTAGFGSLWAASGVSGSVVRIDPKKNLIVARIPVGPSPRFMAAGEGAMWILNRGDGSVSRIDPGSNREVARIAAHIPTKWGDVAIGAGAVWLSVFGTPVTRIDPTSNTVTHQFVGPGGDSVRYGNDALWVTDQKRNELWKIDVLQLLRR